MPLHTDSHLTHIIWDWNGTLLDDVEECVAALNDMLSARRMPRVTVASYREQFGFPVRRYYTELGFDFAVEDWTRLAEEYHAYYARHEPAARVRAGIADALSELARNGVALYVLSASHQALLEGAVGRRGLRGFFGDLRGLSDLFAHSKVEAGRLLLDRHGIPPARTVLVGDTAHDHEVACALGCACVLLAGGHQSTPRLRRCACPVVETVDELSGRLAARVRRW